MEKCHYGVSVTRINREAGRVLLFNDDGHLLLVLGQDPAQPHLGTWWFTPGGGLNEGESHRDGARRELFEETGIDVDLTQEPVFERTVEFPFDGGLYRQHEFFYAAKTYNSSVEPQHLTELELRAVLDTKWWDLADLVHSHEVIHPVVLQDEKWITTVRDLLLGTESVHPSEWKAVQRFATLEPENLHLPQ